MSSSQFKERIEFCGFDKVNRSSLNRVSKALDKRVEKALEDFYARVGNNFVLAAFFENNDSMSRARNLQGDHWKSAFKAPRPVETLPLEDSQSL